MSPIELQSIVFIFIGMFCTQESFRDPLSVHVSQEGSDSWLAAEVVLNRIWYLASFAQRDSADSQVEFERTLLFSDFWGIENLLQADRDVGINLKSVHVITPSCLNGTDAWKMERVSSVWSAVSSAPSTIPIDILETFDGNKYASDSSVFSRKGLAMGLLKFNFQPP